MIKPSLKLVLEDGTEYIDRWHLIPRNRWFNIYLHKTMSDDYRILHDHPWDNISIVLKGGYYETVPAVEYSEHVNPFFWAKVVRWRKPGSIICRKAHWPPHSLSLATVVESLVPRVIKKRVCWSLFITGPRKRDWGFWTRKGWISHEQMVTIKDGKSQMTAKGKELTQ